MPHLTTLVEKGKPNGTDVGRRFRCGVAGIRPIHLLNTVVSGIPPVHRRSCRTCP